MRKPREQIWYSKMPIAQIEVSEKSVPIEDELAERIVTVLRAALRNTASPTEEDFVLDGVQYIFFGPGEAGGEATRNWPMIGQCHSPEKDSDTGRLVQMVDLLVRYVELPPAFRELKTTDERRRWLDQVADGKIVTPWRLWLDENHRPQFDPFLWDPLDSISRAVDRASKSERCDHTAM